MPIAKKNRSISSLEEWFELAPPKSKDHWVDGRSAKEAARAWLAGGDALPSEVAAALASHPSFGEVLNWDAEPEARLRFDEFAGEPRNADLLVLTTDALGPYVVAVEAKADEVYGESVEKTLAAAHRRRRATERSNGVTRVESLLRLLPTVAPGVELPKVGSLRYQLLTACAGAVAEARRRRCARAVMLVHEFVTPATKPENHARNAADLAAFISRLSGAPLDSVVDGQLYGPFELPLAEEVSLFVGKVAHNLRQPVGGEAAVS